MYIGATHLVLPDDIKPGWRFAWDYIKDPTDISTTAFDIK